jgi:hypothetical protein
MAMTPEKRVKVVVRRLLDELQAYYVMPVTGGYGTQGAPDFLVCHRGKFIGIETKAGRGKTTALQDMNLQRIRTAGGVALVVYETDIEMLREVLYKIEIGE